MYLQIASAKGTLLTSAGHWLVSFSGFQEKHEINNLATFTKGLLHIGWVLA